MAMQIGRRSALPELIGHRTGPSAMEIASAVQLQPRLQRSAESSAHNLAAAKLVEGRGDARFVLAVRARRRRRR